MNCMVFYEFQILPSNIYMQNNQKGLLVILIYGVLRYITI